MPFLVFALMSLVPAISLLTFPVEATGKELDDQEVLYHTVPDYKTEQISDFR